MSRIEAVHTIDFSASLEVSFLLHTSVVHTAIAMAMESRMRDEADIEPINSFVLTVVHLDAGAEYVVLIFSKTG